MEAIVTRSMVMVAIAAIAPIAIVSYIAYMRMLWAWLYKTYHPRYLRHFCVTAGTCLYGGICATYYVVQSSPDQPVVAAVLLIWAVAALTAALSLHVARQRSISWLARRGFNVR